MMITVIMMTVKSMEVITAIDADPGWETFLIKAHPGELMKANRRFWIIGQ
jgi:hypothetical protein